MIYHIAGPDACGKTTLYNKLLKHKSKNIIILDLDDFLDNYSKNIDLSKQWNVNKYQQHIDDFIEKNKKKLIIFIGINGDRRNNFYDLHADYKYMIDLDINDNVKRLFIRELNSWLESRLQRDKNILYEQLIKDEKDVIRGWSKSLKRVLSISKMKKHIISFRKKYKKEKYIFMKSDNIYNILLKILK